MLSVPVSGGLASVPGRTAVQVLAGGAAGLANGVGQQLIGNGGHHIDWSAALVDAGVGAGTAGFGAGFTAKTGIDPNTAAAILGGVASFDASAACGALGSLHLTAC